jgi:Pentapeptide repeats (8 copies)
MLAVLVNAQCQGDSTYRSTVFSGAFMKETDLTGADLTGADLGLVYLYGGGTKVDGATVVQTNFASAYLAGMHFKDVAQNQCQAVNFTEACLVGAIFQGTDLSERDGKPCLFDRACLQGADFTDALLGGAVLAGAAVATAAGSIQATILIAWPSTKQSIPPSATTPPRASKPPPTPPPSARARSRVRAKETNSTRQPPGLLAPACLPGARDHRTQGAAVGRRIGEGHTGSVSLTAPLCQGAVGREVSVRSTVPSCSVIPGDDWPLAGGGLCIPEPALLLLPAS